MEGNVKRGPRVGRAVVEEAADNSTIKETSSAKDGKSVGVIDDFTMEKKF